MGHNSCINLFKNRKQYDYLIHIDGDDFLYPYAFHQLYKALIKTKKMINILIYLHYKVMIYYLGINNLIAHLIYI